MDFECRDLCAWQSHIQGIFHRVEPCIWSRLTLAQIEAIAMAAAICRHRLQSQYAYAQFWALVFHRVVQAQNARTSKRQMPFSFLGHSNCLS